MISDSLPERLQGTDGIRGKSWPCLRFSGNGPAFGLDPKKILTEEFFELYTFHSVRI